MTIQNEKYEARNPKQNQNAKWK